MAIINKYKFNSDLISDSVGGITLTNVNTVTTGQLINNAADFGTSNTDKYLKSDSLDTALLSDISISSITKINTLPGNNVYYMFVRVVKQTAYTGKSDLGIGFCNPSNVNQIFAYTYNTTDRVMNYNITLSADKIYYITATRVYSSGLIKLYINGIMATSNTYTPFNPTSSMKIIGIGANYYGTGVGNFSSVKADEITVHNSILNATQIKNDYSYYKGFF
jgi:hypothetical protein